MKKIVIFLCLLFINSYSYAYQIDCYNGKHHVYYADVTHISYHEPMLFFSDHKHQQTIVTNLDCIVR